MKHWILTGVLLGSAVLFSTCKKDQDFCTPAFSVEKFEQNIINEMGNTQMGYCYIILNKGNAIRSGASGKAQNGADGDINMSVELDLHIASISKFITSICAMHVCRIKNVPLTTAIGPYLPTSWSRGTGIDDVTVAELITQTAGLDYTGTQGFNATRFDSLQLVVANGATLSKTRRYTNTHAALLRLVLPRLWNKYKDATGRYDENWFADIYKLMVEELLFDKINISGDMKPKNANQILAYTGSGDNGNGSGGTSDFSLVSGGTGWHLTCYEVAKFWAYSWFSNEFINNSDKQWAKNNRAGLWNTRLGEKYGDYYCKLGGWSYTTAPPTKDMNCLAMLYPNDYSVIIFTNSPVNGSFTKMAADAYDNSFICF